MENSDCFLMNSRMAAVVQAAGKYDKKNTRNRRLLVLYIFNS